MARRAKPRKLEVVLIEGSISNISSDSKSETETTRDSLPKKCALFIAVLLLKVTVSLMILKQVLFLERLKT